MRWGCPRSCNKPLILDRTRLLQSDRRPDFILLPVAHPGTGIRKLVRGLGPATHTRSVAVAIPMLLRSTPRPWRTCQPCERITTCVHRSRLNAGHAIEPGRVSDRERSPRRFPCSTPPPSPSAIRAILRYATTSVGGARRLSICGRAACASGGGASRRRLSIRSPCRARSSPALHIRVCRRGLKPPFSGGCGWCSWVPAVVG